MPFYRKKGSGKGKVKRVPKATKKYVKTALSKRMPKRTKYYQLHNGTEVITTANFSDCSQIAIAGAGVQDDITTYRQSNTIKPQMLYLRGTARMKNTATADNFCRIVVFQWRGERDADPPTANGVFGDGWTVHWFAPLKAELDSAKYTVLWDHTYHMPKQYSGAAVIAGHSDVLIRKNIYLGKRPKIQYLDGTSSKGTNHIYVCVIGNSGTGTNSHIITLDTLLTYQG